MLTRREFAISMAVLPAAACVRLGGETGGSAMYGLIGKFKSTEGKRDELIGYLLEGLKDMPGCLSYVVAKAPDDADTIWVTEVWDTAENHMASLQLPQVQAAIGKARPIIAGMERVSETEVIGGVGL